MTPEERQLISGLFERMRPAANQSRDREAESLIADQVRAQPYAPYLLSQTVIVQDQALQAANQKIQQLEAQVQQGQPRQEDTSFLGGLGRMFGGQPDPNQGRGQTVPTTGGHGPAPLPQDPATFRGQGGPWGGQQTGGAQPGGGLMGGMTSAMGGGGGGFLKGALGAAAGVAGGVLLADGIRDLFHGGNNPYGIASGLGGGMGGLGNPGGETIVNNYYDDNNNQGPEPGNYGDQGGDQGGFDPGDGGYGGGGYSN